MGIVHSDHQNHVAYGSTTGMTNRTQEGTAISRDKVTMGTAGDVLSLVAENAETTTGVHFTLDDAEALLADMNEIVKVMRKKRRIDARREAKVLAQIQRDNLAQLKAEEEERVAAFAQLPLEDQLFSLQQIGA